MKPYRTDENSIIESFRPNRFDLETWLNTFDSVFGNKLCRIFETTV